MDQFGIISIFDLLLLPLLVIVIYFIASDTQRKNIGHNPIYKYYVSGIMVKIGGAIALCVIYLYYYTTGGDTLNYYWTANALKGVFIKDPISFFSILFEGASDENYSIFDHETGYPIYWKDYHALNVAKITAPIVFLSMGSYLAAAVLTAIICFTGVWKLYEMFCEIYPGLYKQFALSILFVPSVVVWGSGILKDTWTLAATGWFSYSFYMIAIRHQRLLYYSVAIVIASAFLILIKPYIFMALMPGCIIWGLWDRITGIKNSFLRVMALPLLITTGFIIGAAVWSMVGDKMGEYSSIDSMVKKAHVASEDMKQEYYQGNSFDLGSYEPTLSGMLAKFPIASVTGMFRPFIWEAKNIVMLLSGMENLVILLFALQTLWTTKAGFISNLYSKPIVLFSILFAVIFSFSVAISTSNFGALVRLRIPMVPFLLAGLYVMKHGRMANYSEAKEERLVPQAAK